MNKALLKTSRWFHKWAGLLLALQILFWILGGLVMSAIPLEKVHGKHLATRDLPVTLQTQVYEFPVQALLSEFDERVLQIALAERLSRPVYLIKTESGERVFDAITGAQVSTLSQQEAEQIAQQHYLQSSAISTSALKDKLPMEAGSRELPHWQVNFDDTWNTTLYVNAHSGQLITVRSDIWRIFDFFWMLHIMDYDEREDFNNPLLISFAASALVFTLTGMVLLIQSFRPKLRKLAS